MEIHGHSICRFNPFSCFYQSKRPSVANKAAVWCSRTREAVAGHFRRKKVSDEDDNVNGCDAMGTF